LARRFTARDAIEAFEITAPARRGVGAPERRQAALHGQPRWALPGRVGEAPGQAAPAISEQTFPAADRDQTGACRIEVHVISQRTVKVAAASLDRDGLVPVAEEPAPRAMPAIEAPGIHVLQPFHTGDQVGLGRFQKQVVVIVQQHPSVDAPPGAAASFGQGGEPVAPVVLIPENRLPPIAPRHDVIERACILESDVASHEAEPQTPTARCQDMLTDPYRPCIAPRK
jgi:hypothetical protein